MKKYYNNFFFQKKLINLYIILAVVFVFYLLFNPGYYWQDYNYIKSRSFFYSLWNYQETNSYHTYFRPLMFFHLRLFDFFGITEFQYNIFNSLSWILAVIIFYKVFKIENYIKNYFFVFILSFPVFSYAIVVSGQYITLAHALILIFIGAAFYEKYLLKNNTIFLFLSFFFIILGLLTYEIVVVSFPLFFLLVKKKNYLKLFIFLLIISLLIFFYNKFLIEIFFDRDSRIRTLDYKLLPIFLSNTIIVIRILFIDILLYYKDTFISLFSIQKFSEILLIIFLFSTILLIIYLNKSLNNSFLKKKIITVFLISVILNIFVLSIANFPPFIFGNYNRGFYSISFLISLILVLITNSKNNLIRLFGIFLIFIHCFGFIKIRSNFESIEQFKFKILKDISSPSKKILIFPIGHKYNSLGEEIYETENDKNNIFYGHGPFKSFYNNKYNLKIDNRDFKFLLHTRACELHHSNKFFGISKNHEVLLYNHELSLKKFLINNRIDYNLLLNDLSCERAKKINYYYSQSFVLNEQCKNYFLLSNNFNKFYCRSIISSYRNYNNFKKYF